MEEEKIIRLGKLEDVKDFVNAASQCDFDIDIFYNRMIVDAKSFLGVLCLDLNSNLTVSCRGYSKDFQQILEKYEVVS